jgi:membrane protein YqaA with SNARE-associated domain
MLKNIYDRLLLLSHKGYAQAVLAGVAFLESSVFPIPPDAFLVPFALANRQRAWRFAAIATVFSVLGGFLGYAIGFYFADTIGQRILNFYGSPSAYQDFQAWFARWGVYVILIKGLTPIPYKLVTIACGLAHFDLFTFAWSSLVTRGCRFFLLTFLAWKFGPAAMPHIERNLGRICLGVLALAVVGVGAAHFLK